MAGSLRLRGRSLLKLRKGTETSLLSLSQISRVSYPTILRYLTSPEDVKMLDLSVLANILVDGFGMAPKEILDMKVGDLFEYERTP